MLEEMGGFTLFVLSVSIGLSFVLRKLIVEIDRTKADLAREIQDLTAQLVEENPSLEKYQQLGELYFRLDQFDEALKVFDYLLSQGVFEREGRFFRVLCLLGLNQTSEAKELFEKLNLASYTQGEISQLKGALRRKTSFLRFGEMILNLLLTNVSFQLGPEMELGSNSGEQELNRILTHIPTRYEEVGLVDEKDDSFVFRCRDRHLERMVRLHVAKPDLSDEDTRHFLTHPRILAKFQSRAFPQVYDLQHSKVTFYCQEEFEGETLPIILGEFRSSSRDQEFLSLWISLLSHIEFLQEREVRLQRFLLGEIGYDRRKDRLFFSGNLMKQSRESLPENQRQIRQVLSQSLEDHLKYQEKVADELQELSTRLRITAQVSDVPSLRRLLEEVANQMVSWQDSSSKFYLQQLIHLEKIHRASIHGLKGKFSIVGRYSDEPHKLLKTFFRSSNVEDVKDKILFLMELIAQLESMMDGGFFPICAEIREKDFIAFMEQLDSFVQLDFDAPGFKPDEAHSFLKDQNQYFETLSDKLATFITEHELHLPRTLEDLVQGVSDRKRVQLEIHEDSGSVKVCAMDREVFLDKIKLIVENLINNSLEAGCETVTIRVYTPEPGSVLVDIKDDGPGIPPEILEELVRSETYSLGEGGTGLIASKNAVEFLGGDLMINPEHISRGTLIRISLTAYLA